MKILSSDIIHKSHYSFVEAQNPSLALQTNWDMSLHVIEKCTSAMLENQARENWFWKMTYDTFCSISIRYPI